MPSLDDVVAAREQDHETEQEAAPVHAVWRYRYRAGEECEDQNWE